MSFIVYYDLYDWQTYEYAYYVYFIEFHLIYESAVAITTLTETNNTQAETAMQSAAQQGKYILLKEMPADPP